MALPTPYARENINYDFEKSMYFPGEANGQLFIPGSDHTFDFLPTEAFTMGGWLKIVDNSRVNIICQKKQNNVKGFILLAFRDPNNGWCLSLQEAKAFSQEIYAIPLDIRDPFFWTITNDPAQKLIGGGHKDIKFYLNGDLLNLEQHRTSNMSRANLVADTTSTFFLGGDFNVQNLEGWQDNFFLHKGKAYTHEQVAKTYYNREPAVRGVSAFYRFNSQVGNTILDDSGNGHTLTMANAVELQDDQFPHGWTRDAY